MVSVVLISKNEDGLNDTLLRLEDEFRRVATSCEAIVVDASDGALDYIRDSHPNVLWVAYKAAPDVRVSIPQQRNLGIKAAQSGIVVFLDAGCVPRPGWLQALIAPILNEGESVCAGPVVSGDGQLKGYDSVWAGNPDVQYLRECPTINLAIARSVFSKIGYFDERFEYGSDTDFSWRVVDAGLQIRAVHEASISHEWGSLSKQIKRSFRYGKARVRLYRKHPGRLRDIGRYDRTFAIYPAYAAGLVVLPFFPLYVLPLVLAIYKARGRGGLISVAGYLSFGFGALSECSSVVRARLMG